MKKDIEWLKEAIGELDLVDTVFDVGGVSYIDTAVSVMQVYDLIDELDEQEVLSRKWIEEHTYYEDEYDFYYADPDEFKNLLVPKQEELESKIKVLIEAYKQEDGAYSNPENGWISGFVEDLENLVEEEPLYYAKLKDVHPLKKEWLVNLTTPKYYVVNTRGLMFGEFTLDLVGVKTNASAYNLEDWGSYGINDDIVDFVRAGEER